MEVEEQILNSYSYLEGFTIAILTDALLKDYYPKFQYIKKGMLLELYLVYCTYLYTGNGSIVKGFWTFFDHLFVLPVTAKALWIACQRLKEKHCISKMKVRDCFNEETIEFRETLEAALERLFNKFGIQSVLDAFYKKVGTLQSNVSFSQTEISSTVEWTNSDSTDFVADLIDGEGLGTNMYKKLSSKISTAPKIDNIRNVINERSTIASKVSSEELLSDGFTYTISKADIETKVNKIANSLYQYGFLVPTNGSIRLKISGDGFIMKRKSWVFFSITFLDVPSPHKEYANWLLCLADCDEISPVTLCMATDIETNLFELQQTKIDLDNMKVPVIYYFSADQKFLSYILGLKGPKSVHFCPFCNITKAVSQTMTGTGILRSKDDLRKGISSGQFAKAKLLSIMEDIVPDVLHLTMRCTEKLIQQIWIDLQRSSSKEQNFDVQTAFLTKFRTITNQPSFNFVEKQDYIRKPNLTGDQTYKVIDKLPELLFYAPKEQQNHYKLKQELLTLHNSIFLKLRQKTLNTEEISALTHDIKRWGVVWMLCFPKGMSNSCHITWHHLPDYLAKFGGLFDFSQEAVESLVKLVKQNGANIMKSSKTISKLILEKDARRVVRLPFKLQDLKNKKCKSCGQTGHSRISNKMCPKYGLSLSKKK